MVKIMNRDGWYGDILTTGTTTSGQQIALVKFLQPCADRYSYEYFVLPEMDEDGAYPVYVQDSIGALVDEDAEVSDWAQSDREAAMRDFIANYENEG